jgi:hypothetical protein
LNSKNSVSAHQQQQAGSSSRSVVCSCVCSICSCLEATQLRQCSGAVQPGCKVCMRLATCHVCCGWQVQLHCTAVPKPAS